MKPNDGLTVDSLRVLLDAAGLPGAEVRDGEGREDGCVVAYLDDRYIPVRPDGTVFGWPGGIPALMKAHADAVAARHDSAARVLGEPDVEGVRALKTGVRELTAALIEAQRDARTLATCLAGWLAWDPSQPDDSPANDNVSTEIAALLRRYAPKARDDVRAALDGKWRDLTLDQCRAILAAMEVA